MIDAKMSNRARFMISEDLLVEEIFKRLPVKTLCRFRCVFKRWNSQISSPYFIGLHHSFTTTSTTPPHRKPYLLMNIMYTIYHPQELNHLTHYRFPFGFRYIKHVPFDFVDVIRGVVCVSYSLSSSLYVILPRPIVDNMPLEKTWSWFVSLRRSQLNTIGLGFGCDTSKNDFKVVRVWIPSARNDLKPTMYEVFSSQEGRWREAVADNIKTYGFITTTSFFFNGTVHWLVSTPINVGEKYSLLMFECCQEGFTAVDLPEEVNRMVNTTPHHEFAQLSEYSGKLSVLQYLRRERRLEVWVMDEHGVPSTWKKLFSIEKGLAFYNINVIMLREDGDIIQPEYLELASSDPNKGMIGVERFYQPLNGRVYEESLFLMDATECKSYTKEETVHI